MVKLLLPFWTFYPESSYQFEIQSTSLNRGHKHPQMIHCGSLKFWRRWTHMAHNKHMGIYVDLKLDIPLFLILRSSGIDIPFALWNHVLDTPAYPLQVQGYLHRVINLYKERLLWIKAKYSQRDTDRYKFEEIILEECNETAKLKKKETHNCKNINLLLYLF